MCQAERTNDRRPQTNETSTHRGGLAAIGSVVAKCQKFFRAGTGPQMKAAPILRCGDRGRVLLCHYEGAITLSDSGRCPWVLFLLSDQKFWITLDGIAVRATAKKNPSRRGVRGRLGSLLPLR
jgi:hypothetical protein